MGEGGWNPSISFSLRYGILIDSLLCRVQDDDYIMG